MPNVDKRVVQMQFDNKQFESGIHTSMSSLDKLKKGLNLEGASKGLSNLEKAGRSFSLDGIASGVETISSKFTTLGLIGVTALQNITNSAINTGKRMISALTIDPIKAGLGEYETKMNAITTIMTNTASKGTTLDDVNVTLNELNEYADKTIYNFAEMTKNIGTFTAAGIDLKTSATAIKGIANLAAGSGSNAQQASTAMYQLSQALAAGSVKLQDWNSVVNAGMGGELFKNALQETAKEHGVNVDAMIAKNGSFRESLQEGWITADILTKTLEKFANDESLIKAATEVKTFTQLMDTMKESVQSGWAQSWEAIIGDKDQATKMLTAINDAFGGIVGPIADARNAMLQFWNANGGRDAIIQSFANAFKFLSDVLRPIGEAFREIFPPMTGERLVEISNKIKALTENFKIGEGTADNLKRTFKGLFALLDIGKQAFFAVAEGISTLVKYLFPASEGILSFTGSIGDFLVSLNESIKNSGIFTVGIEKIAGIIKLLAEGFSIAISTILNGFGVLSSFDVTGITENFKPISLLGDIMSNIFGGLGDLIKKVAPGFFEFASTIGGVLKNLAKSISDGLKNADFGSIADILNSGLFAGILIGIKKFIDSLTGITDNAGGFLENIVGIFDGVRGSLEAYQSNLKAKTLLTIAAAIGILAASLIAMSTIDEEKMASSLSAITLLFVELFGSMSVFEKLVKGPGFKSMSTISLGMLAMSTSVLILASAMQKLGELDWDQIGRGLVGVGVLMAELTLFMKMTDTGGMGLRSSIGLIALAIAVNILASAVKKISEVDPEALTRGLVGMAAVLAEVAIFVRMTGDSKKVISTATGLVILGAAMFIFATAIEKMGNLSLEQIGKGLLTMGAALGIIIAALKFMPKNTAVIGLGLLLISTALLGLSTALQNMGGMDWMEIGKGLVVLAGALTIITVAMHFMSTSLAGAAALLVVASALAILTPVLKALGSMSIIEIAKSLLALAGTFAVIGIAAALLTPVIPAMLGLAGAMALLGIGVLAVGAGLMFFAAGLTALAVSGAAGAAALVAIVSGLVGLIPYIFQTIAQGIIDFAKIIADGAVIIAESVTAVIMAIIDTVAKNTPAIVDSGMKIIIEFLTGIKNNIKKLVTVAIDVVLNFIAGIKEALPRVIQAGYDFIITFINSLADALRNNTDALIDAMENLMDAIITAGKKALTASISGFTQIGKDVVNGFINGIKNTIKNVGSVVANLGTAALKGLSSKLGIRSPSREFMKLGAYSTEGFANGLTKYSSLASEASAGIGQNAMDSLSKSMSKISDVVNGDIDINPTIRPVVDMTDVEKGLASTFGQAQGLKVGGVVSRASSVSARNAALSNAITQSNVATSNEIQIVNHYNVRNDSDINKISRDLRTTMERYGLAKGVALV